MYTKGISKCHLYTYFINPHNGKTLQGKTGPELKSQNP